MNTTFIKDYFNEYWNLVEQLREYTLKSKLHTLIIGISGGMDSCLVTAIANDATINLPRVNLLGFYLPSKTNKIDEENRAMRTIKSFCQYGEKVDIQNAIDENIAMCGIGFHEDHVNSLTENMKIQAGNVKARTRMIYLYNAAKEYNGAVLGTGNYTEYMLNFFTLHGDCGDIEVLRNIWKSDVYELAKHRAMQFKKENEKTNINADKYTAIMDTINAIPTDGLGISKSDFDQFGFDSTSISDKHPHDIYRIIDETLIKWHDAIDDTNDELIESMRHNKIVKLHRPEFKRNNPFILKRI